MIDDDDIDDDELEIDDNSVVECAPRYPASVLMAVDVIVTDAALTIEPPGLSQAERERWTAWQCEHSRSYVPSPSQIEAAKAVFRQSTESLRRRVTRRRYAA